MSKKLPLTDFRAVRRKLEPHEFAISEGQDTPPSDLVEEDVWNGIMHLPEDVSIRVSDHNGTRLRLLYGLRCDWTTAIGTTGEEDELYSCMLDAGDCFQCAIFNFLHGFYRAALAELRTAFELVMIGTYGNRNPTSEKYLSWKAGATTEFGFTQCRKGLLGSLKKEEAKWLFEKDRILATTYQTLCNYTHSRPDASDGALWQSNGPVYHNASIHLTFITALDVFAQCYLLTRLARPTSQVPEDSEILYELDWMLNYKVLVQAYTELYGKPPRPPLKE